MRLLSSVRIISTNKKVILKAVKEYAADLKKRPEVEEVYLCGSWAKGNYSPYSDVDILIVINKEDGNMPHERVLFYLPDRFPTSLDLFIYTKDELKKSSFALSLLEHAVKL